VTSASSVAKYLNCIIFLGKMKQANNFIKSSSILFIAVMIGNIANYLFQFFMGHNLSTSDFGILNSLLSLMMIGAVPAGTIMLVMARYISKFKAGEEWGKVTKFYKNSLKRMTLSTCIVIIFFLFLNGRITAFMKIPSSWPVIILGSTLFVSLLLPVNIGTLQGLQRFGYLGINACFGGVSRLLFGILFVSLGLRVNGALLATLLSALVIMIITFYPLKSLFNQRLSSNIESHTREIITYSLPVILATVSFMIITNIDLVLVKHYFSPEEAGYYAGAAVLGRSVLYLPGVIVMVIFPMISESHTLNKDTYGLLNKGLLLTAILAGTGMLSFLVMPEIMITFLFGNKFIEAAPLLRLFGVAMFPLALINIIINFNLARNKSRFIYSLVISCLLEVLLIIFFHNSLLYILYILIGNGILLLFLNIIFILIEKRVSLRSVSTETFLEADIAKL